MKERVKKFFSSIALFSIELIVIWVIFIISFLIFLFVSKEVISRDQEIFDYKVFSWIDKISSEGLTMVMRSITFFANREFVFVLALTIFLYFVFIKKHKWYSLKIPVVAIGSISLNLILKSMFDRPRPFLTHLVEASGHSFPSGHAMISFSFYGLLIYLIWKEVQNKTLRIFLVVFFLILIHLIGFSRIYLKVHFASDVIAGFSLGIIWLIMSIAVLKKMESFSAKKIASISDT